MADGALAVIRPLGFLNTWPLAATLFAKGRDRFAEIAPGVSVLAADERLQGEWRALKGFLRRLDTAARSGVDHVTFKHVMFIRLDGGADIIVPANDALGYLRICLVAQPNAVHAMPTGVTTPLGVGFVNLFDAGAPHWWVNRGDTETVELVIELARPGAVDEEDDAEAG